MQTQIKKLDFTGQNIYTGIDVHKKGWKVSIYSDELHHKTFSQDPSPKELYDYLCRNFPNATYHTVYEAGLCGFWIHDRFKEFGINSIVTNPADVPTNDKERRRKTDRVDCNKLARHLRSNELDAIYAPNQIALEDRLLVRKRKTLVADLTRYKNRIKSDLCFFGIEIPEQFTSNQSHWSKRFIRWLEALEFERWTGTYSLQILLRQAKTLREDLLDANRKIRVLAMEQKYENRVKILMTLPGIGLTTAMMILTEIDDIHRFANREKLRSYVGLTPSSHSSGDSDRHGEMIHRGNKFLRPAMIESAWTAARTDPGLHMDYVNFCKRMKGNKAIIRIATKLLDRVHYVLKNDMPYKSGTN
jgi:transposase